MSQASATHSPEPPAAKVNARASSCEARRDTVMSVGDPDVQWRSGVSAQSRAARQSCGRKGRRCDECARERDGYERDIGSQEGQYATGFTSIHAFRAVAKKCRTHGAANAAQAAGDQRHFATHTEECIRVERCKVVVGVHSKREVEGVSEGDRVASKLNSRARAPQKSPSPSARPDSKCKTLTLRCLSNVLC